MDLRRHLFLPILLMVASGSTMVAAPAQAQTVEDGTITVIQPRPVLRRNRVDLSTSFGTTLNTPLYRQYVVTGSLGFNISETLSIAGTFEWFDFDDALGGKTQDYEDVIGTTVSVPGVVTVCVDVVFVANPEHAHTLSNRMSVPTTAARARRNARNRLFVGFA